MKLTLSKTIKIPIPGVQFSNQVVSVTEEHEFAKTPGDEDVVKLWGGLNKRLEIGRDDDLGTQPEQTEWLRKPVEPPKKRS